MDLIILIPVLLGAYLLYKLNWKEITSRVEWDILKKFFVGLLIWLFVGMPLLNSMAQQNSMLSYLVYLGIIGVLGYMIGGTVHRSLESLVVSISLMLATDLIGPPMLIDYNVAPVAQTLARWGSDSFVYQLWAMTGAVHPVLWVLTYILTPTLCMFMILYFLSGKKLGDALKAMFNGGVF